MFVFAKKINSRETLKQTTRRTERRHVCYYLINATRSLTSQQPLAHGICSLSLIFLKRSKLRDLLFHSVLVSQNIKKHNVKSLYLSKKRRKKYFLLLMFLVFVTYMSESPIVFTTNFSLFYYL